MTRRIAQGSAAVAVAFAPLTVLVFQSAAVAETVVQVTTETLVVPLEKVATPTASVSAVHDAGGVVHIAWVGNPGDGSKRAEIRYTRFDTSDKTFTSAIVSDLAIETQAAPSIAVDAAGVTHVVWFARRDRSKGTRPGNYAVYYARRQDDGSFAVSQVSTNSSDPGDRTGGAFHCYVNGRPQVSIAPDGGARVVYLSYSGEETGYDKFLIEARGGPGAWRHRKLFDPEVFGTFSVDSGVTLPARGAPGNHMVWIEISKHVPLFRFERDGDWVGGGFPKYAGLSAIKHVQIESDLTGGVHMFWHSSQREPQREFFCRTRLTGEQPGTVQEIPVQGRVDGNFRPATIDRSTGRFVGFYQAQSGSGTLVIEQASGAFTEQLVTGIGVVYGKRALDVHDGMISLVTAGKGKLFVTYGSLSE